MIEQITVNPSNESLFSADFITGFRCGAHRQFQADVEKIAKAKFGRPTGEWTDDMKCTNCGFQDDDFGIKQIMKCTFCPNCGARMEVK